MSRCDDASIMRDRFYNNSNKEISKYQFLNSFFRLQNDVPIILRMSPDREATSWKLCLSFPIVVARVTTLLPLITYTQYLSYILLLTQNISIHMSHTNILSLFLFFSDKTKQTKLPIKQNFSIITSTMFCICFFHLPSRVYIAETHRYIYF